MVAIDESADDLRTLARHLNEIAGWNGALSTFTEPGTALERLKICRPKVVLVGYRLGQRTGFDVVRDMRKAGHSVPVILIVGSDDEEVATRAVADGVDDCLPRRMLSARVLERAITNVVERDQLRRGTNERCRRLQRTIRDLRARHEEIESFYQTLAHELKTPLTATREFIAIVLDGLAGPVNAEQREYLDTALGNCDHLVISINDILDVSRLESGRLALHTQDIALAGVIHGAVASTLSMAQAKGLELSSELEPYLPLARIDGARVAQILINLLSNAIKFTDEGSIVVRARSFAADGKFLEVAVCDTGRGIDPTKIDRIFERLYQVRSDDCSALGGLGLGLSICREIVRQHTGEIRVESELGKGSSFYFTVPRAPVTPEVLPTSLEACSASGGTS